MTTRQSIRTHQLLAVRQRVYIGQDSDEVDIRAIPF